MPSLLPIVEILHKLNFYDSLSIFQRFSLSWRQAHKTRLTLGVATDGVSTECSVKYHRTLGACLYKHININFFLENWTLQTREI